MPVTNLRPPNHQRCDSQWQEYDRPRPYHRPYHFQERTHSSNDTSWRRDTHARGNTLERNNNTKDHAIPRRNSDTHNQNKCNPSEILLDTTRKLPKTTAEGKETTLIKPRRILIEELPQTLNRSLSEEQLSNIDPCSLPSPSLTKAKEVTHHFLEVGQKSIPPDIKPQSNSRQSM